MCSGVGGTTRPHSYRKRYARRPSEPLGSWPRKRAFSAPSFNWQTPWRRRCQRRMVAPSSRSRSPVTGAQCRVSPYARRQRRLTSPVVRSTHRFASPPSGRHPIQRHLAQPNLCLPPGTGRQPTGAGGPVQRDSGNAPNSALSVRTWLLPRGTPNPFAPDVAFRVPIETGLRFAPSLPLVAARTLGSRPNDGTAARAFPAIHPVSP